MNDRSFSTANHGKTTRHAKDIIIWSFILTSMENLMDEYTFNYDSY